MGEAPNLGAKDRVVASDNRLAKRALHNPARRDCLARWPLLVPWKRDQHRDDRESVEHARRWGGRR